MFKILVVDDDPNVNKSICTFLNRNGYQAAGCTNVNDALYKMYDEPFDLVISDIMMPGTDGFEFAENLNCLCVSANPAGSPACHCIRF